MWDYRAQLVRVVDGDSVILLIDVGMGARVEEEIRLVGVSAPEHYQPGGLESRDFTAAWFKQLPQTRKWPVALRTTPNTTLEPLEKFYPAEAYHQNYACRNPMEGYVRGIALPKVAKVREKFKQALKRE